MRPSIALNMKREAVRSAVKRYRTANPRIFGSVLRGSDRDGSDLDLLVDALPGATLFDLGGLQEELQTLLCEPPQTCHQHFAPKFSRRHSHCE